MKVALVLMIKDEVELLEAWLNYHSNLFGAESIFLLDNGSANPETLRILSSWEQQVGKINFKFRTANDYKNKPQIYIELIRDLELLGFDVFFPMDCDEFIAVDNDGVISIDASDIKLELSRYWDVEKILRIKYALDNTPLDSLVFNKSPQRKCFFYKNVCKGSDHGFHESESFKYGVDFVVTNIIYIHYHFRSYDDYIRSAKDKLSPWISDFSKKSLIEYRKNRGPGFHLIDTLLQDPVLYYFNQRSRTYGASNVRLNSFRDFMDGRGLLKGFNSDLLDFSLDELGWILHVDYFQYNHDVLVVKGWGFNLSKDMSAVIRLRMDYSVTAPVDYKSIVRPDVVSAHSGASLLCGFEINFSIKSTSNIEKVGLFFASSEKILGHYLELPKITIV